MASLFDTVSSRDLRWPAVAASCLISLLVIAANPIPNDDAFSYLRAAEVFARDGLGAILLSYGWYGYSVLIAATSHIIPGDLVASAHVLNILALGLLVYSFITLAAEFDASPRVQLFATAVILCFPTLNEMRFNLVRDFAFWGFCLAALVQLVRYNRTGASIHAAGWLVAMAAAVFFRLEGLIMMAAAPLALLLPGIRPLRDRIRLAAILLVLVVAGALVILLVFLPAEVNLVEVFNFTWRWYLPLLADYPDTLAGAATREALNYRISPEMEIFTGKGFLVLIIGYLYTVVANLVMATGPAAIVFLLYTGYTCRPTLPAACRGPWRGYFASTLLALMVFVSIMQFLTTRYAVMAALLLLSLAPLAIDALYRKAEATGNLYRFRIIFAACVVYFLIDSLVSFGYSKRYVEDAIAWTQDNIDSGSTLVTNNLAVAFFSRRVADYDKVDTDPMALLEAPAESDYLILDLAHDHDRAQAHLARRTDLSELARFANRREDAIIIYRVD